MQLPAGFGDPIFASFDPSRPFLSMMPSGALLEGAAVSTYFQNLISKHSAEFLFSQTENALHIARSVLQWDAVNLGVRAAELSALADVFVAAVRLGGNDARDIVDYLKFAGKVLDATWQLLDAALSTFAAIPIVGIIFQAAKMILSGVVALLESLKAERAKKRKIAPDAIAYDKERDEDITRLLLQAARSRDWTPIFLPYSEAQWDITPVAYAENGIADGRRFGPVQLQAREPAIGYGCFPQLAEQFAEWQYADRLADENNRWRPRPTGFSQWHPSMVQAAVVLWQRVMDYSPRMFSVDMWRVESAWQTFFSEGFDLAKRMDQQGNRTAALNIADACSFTMLRAVRAGQSVGSACGSTVQYENYNCWTMPDEYLVPALTDFGEPVSYGELIRYVRKEVWHPRARAAMKTIICAYVEDSPDFPGLHNADPKLKDLWDDMRRELLRRTAVRDVELDLIPDEPYRAAVKEAQKSVKEITLAPSPEPKLDTPWLVLDLSLVTDLDPPPLPPTGLEPGVAGGDAPDKSDGGVVAMAALGALGLFAATR